MSVFPMNDAEKKPLMEIRTKSFRLEIYERDPIVDGLVSSLSDWVKGKSEDREEEAPEKKNLKN